MDEMRAIVSRGLARAGRAATAAPRSGRTPAGSTRAASAVVGRGEWRKRLLEIVEKVAASRATVLLSGESGTGKELFAREIHSSSPRANKPFIAVACAALSRDLLESELFGHEKGAFTGAQYQKPGRFELADEGTLFLDEIGEIPLDLQVKLLRVLQEREFERVGGTETIKVDVRLLAATNKDLAESVGRGEFREDLYYRLQVVEIHLPPLRERREDIADLAAHFLTQYAAENGRALREIGPDALAVLEAHSWPGNVRELENAIEHSVVMADSTAKTLTRDLLPAGLLAQAAPGLERTPPRRPATKKAPAKSRSAKRG
jgi:transcriptional regulator with GAF, ATPase, and Fis domain